MTNSIQRKAFETLRNHAPKDARDEYVKALKELVLRYNTSIRENRFIVGGAVECFTCAFVEEFICGKAQPIGLINSRETAFSNGLRNIVCAC